jgi:hypothetical protein
MHDIGQLIAVLAIAVLAPIIVAIYMANRVDKRHREDRAADWQREDEKEAKRLKAAEKVAARAETAASDLAASQKKIADQAAVAAELLVASNERAAANAELTLGKLDQIDKQAKRIHTLVNSDMTAARQEQLDQIRITVTVLKRVIDLAAKNGIKPDKQDVESLARAESRVAELESILADRAHQMQLVEAERERLSKSGETEIEEAASKEGR